MSSLWMRLGVFFCVRACSRQAGEVVTAAFSELSGHCFVLAGLCVRAVVCVCMLV